MNGKEKGYNSMNIIKRCLKLQVVDVIKTAGIVLNSSGLSFMYMAIVHDNIPCQCPEMRQKLYRLMATWKKALLWRSVEDLGGIGLLL